MPADCCDIDSAESAAAQPRFAQNFPSFPRWEDLKKSTIFTESDLVLEISSRIEVLTNNVKSNELAGSGWHSV